MRIKTLDLFSGIGGFSYALKSVCETVAYCERAKYCKDILNNNMNRGFIDKAPIFDDIKRLTADHLPNGVEMITAGFPCQDVSIANIKGKGIAGLRSTLVNEVFRLVDDMPSVKIVMLENSPIIIKRGMTKILEQLHQRGFDCKWKIISAQDVGAPMIRKRWFCVATREMPLKRYWLFTVPLTHAEPIEHKWLKETVDRLVPKENIKYDIASEHVQRNYILKNAVVPQCVVQAYNLLLLGSNPHEISRHPGANIVMKIGNTTKEYTYWTSPTDSSFHQTNLYTRTSDRSTRTIANQIMYDKTTKQQYKSSQLLGKKYRVNPCWVEWLMGFPVHYTEMPDYQYNPKFNRRKNAQ